MPPTQKKIVRTIRRPKAPNPVSVAVPDDVKTPALEPPPAADAAADTPDLAVEDTPEPLHTSADASIDAVSISTEASSLEPLPAETLAVNPAETPSAKPLVKPGTKIIKRVKKIVRKKVVPMAVNASIEALTSEALSLDLAEKTSSEPQQVMKINAMEESTPAADAKPYLEAVLEPETTISAAAAGDAPIVNITTAELELKEAPLVEHVSVEAAGMESSETTAAAKSPAESRPLIEHISVEAAGMESSEMTAAAKPQAKSRPLIEHISVEAAGMESSETTAAAKPQDKSLPLIEHISVEAAGMESSEAPAAAKPHAKSRPRMIKVVRKVVRKKAVAEPLTIVDASPSMVDDSREPEPEPEKETVATASSISSIPASELASEKAPSIQALATEALAVEPTEPGLKAIKRVRKVVRKKIVKKLVPKGSVTTKKVDTIPKQEDSVNTAACHKVPYPSPIQDNSIRPKAAVSLPETKGKDPKLTGIQQSKLVSNRLKPQMEEAGKLVSVESDNHMKNKKLCDQVKAKGDILDGRKSNDQAEISELKEDDLDVLSERRKRRKTEIFVGGLDRNVKEEDLKRVFGKVGEILEVRIMMDGQTGKNKGYAFMRYAEPSQAKRAVAELTRVEICGKTCGAAAVQSDAIYIGNIDKKWRDEDVIKLLKEAGVEKIDAVNVVMDSSNTNSNRGYAFLELETNADAQRAYKKLQKKDLLGKGRNIKVSWADSFTIPDEEEMKKVKSVYAEGVPDSWDEARLMDSFKKFGEIERIVLSRNIKSAKRRDFAFINYKTREAALSCIQTFRSEELSDNGSKINLKVELAKRVQKVKQIKVQNSTNNYVLKQKYNPVQGLASQDNSPAVLSAKRSFSSLGNDTLYSDLRGYTRARLDSSYGLLGSSYGMSHSLAGSSLSQYQHRPLHDAYSTGSFYGSGGHTDQIIREGASPHAGGLYPRFRSNVRDGNDFLWRL